VPAPDLEPLSWRALEALREALRGVTRSNGYHTDIGAGRIVLDDSEVDGDGTDEAVLLIDASDLDGIAGGRGHNSAGMEITFEFVVPRTREVNAKLQAHRGCADLVRALTFKTSGRDTALPPGFRSFELTGGRLRGFTDEDEGASFVIAQVTARAGLTHTQSPAP